HLQLSHLSAAFDSNSAVGETNEHGPSVYAADRLGIDEQSLLPERLANGRIIAASDIEQSIIAEHLRRARELDLETPPLRAQVQHRFEQNRESRISEHGRLFRGALRIDRCGWE